MPHDVDHHAILDRLAATRGGARNAFSAIDPAKTADDQVLVIATLLWLADLAGLGRPWSQTRWSSC